MSVDLYATARRGSALKAAKLDEATVREIRATHAVKEELKRALDQKFSAAAFAARHGVHVNTITKVLTYATWRHVL